MNAEKAKTVYENAPANLWRKSIFQDGKYVLVMEDEDGEWFLSAGGGLNHRGILLETGKGELFCWKYGRGQKMPVKTEY